MGSIFYFWFNDTSVLQSCHNSIKFCAFFKLKIALQVTDVLNFLKVILKLILLE